MNPPTFKSHGGDFLPSMARPSYRILTDLLVECKAPKLVPRIVPRTHGESQKITDNHRHTENPESLVHQRIVSIYGHLQEHPVSCDFGLRSQRPRVRIAAGAPIFLPYLHVFTAGYIPQMSSQTPGRVGHKFLSTPLAL